MRLKTAQRLAFHLLKLPEEVRAGYDVSSIETVIHAAAPCPAPVKKQMIEWFGPVIHEYYAGSEGNGFVYCNSEQWLAHEGTVGTPIVGVLHIVGEDGEEVPTGESGTVYFESDAEFEYHNDPEKTAASRHPKGWTTLGDVGYLDADGFLSAEEFAEHGPERQDHAEDVVAEVEGDAKRHGGEYRLGVRGEVGPRDVDRLDGS